MQTDSLSLPFGSTFISLRDVASYLDVSPATVYRMVDRGLLTVYRVARRLRFTKHDVTRFLERSKTPARYGGSQD